MDVVPPTATGEGDDGELRDCIRRLVTVIRSASSGDSPMDTQQLAHLKKVVRLLSMSDEQLDAMGDGERVQVHPSPESVVVVRWDGSRLRV